LAQAAMTIPDIDFASKSDAIAARDSLNDQLEEAILKAGDDGFDEGYTALSNLRTAVTREIDERAVVLPNLTTFRSGDVIPALAMAYNFYGDASYDLEIVARNKVRNPLFMPGNTDIEVLA